MKERMYQIEFKTLIIRMLTELRKILHEHMRTREIRTRKYKKEPVKTKNKITEMKKHTKGKKEPTR